MWLGMMRMTEPRMKLVTMAVAGTVRFGMRVDLCLFHTVGPPVIRTSPPNGPSLVRFISLRSWPSNVA